jgi:hypothetical protein
MHSGIRRRAAVAALLAATVGLSGAVSACGTAGDTSAVCAGAVRAFGDLSARLSTVPPTDPAQWQRASGDMAARLDALAKRSGDARLKSELTAMAGSWRSFGGAVASTGETAGLSAMLAGQPRSLSLACGG